MLVSPEHEASTSAAPALEMTLLVGPNFNLPAFDLLSNNSLYRTSR